jgi:hypothetical protein
MGPNALFSFYQIIKTKNIVLFIKFRHLPPAVYRDFFGAVGRRSGALFFARHLDYFIVTQNLHPSPGLGTVKTNYRDKKLFTIYLDWQKTRHRDADGN